MYVSDRYFEMEPPYKLMWHHLNYSECNQKYLKDILPVTQKCKDNLVYEKAH